MSVIDPRTQLVELVGNTTVIKNTENPDWPDQVLMNYMFEQTQVVKIQVYDQDTIDYMNLQKQDYIGEISFTLAKLMRSPNQKITVNVTGYILLKFS